MKGIACTGAVVAVLIWPTSAAADEDSFEVDTTSASAALTACTAAAADCSLPGAFTNADDGDSADDEDTISFASSPFDGVESTPGDATVVLTDDLVSDEPLVLNASCASPGPCAGIDGPQVTNAISVTTGTFEMSRVAIFGTPQASGIAYLGFATELTVSDSYFGTKLDGTVDGNQFGITLTGDNATVGLVEEAPNFFAGNQVGIQAFASGTGQVIQNNAFGIRPNGAIAGNSDADINLEGNGLGSDPGEIRIGAEPNATAICDAGCNVIAATGGISATGIDMAGSGPGTSTAFDVDILGNHIGMNALGTASIGTAGALVEVGEADDVTIQGNQLGGGVLGVTNSGASESANLLVDDNSFGLNAAEDAVLAGPTSPAVTLSSDPLNPVTVARNRIANPGTISSSLISIEGNGATVDENVLGLPGVAGSGGEDAIYLANSSGPNLVEENSISEATGHGIVLDGVNSTEVAGNEIGVDGPIGGSGILLRDDPFATQFNTIGGAEEARANVIENVAADGIRIEGGASDFNAVQVNLGKNAGGLFLNLVAGANEGINKPRITSVEKEMVEGEGDPDAKVSLFLSRSDEKVVPTGLKAFIAKKNVKDDGTWKLTPGENIGKNEVLTALQTDSDGNSSELTKGKQRRN